MTLFPVSLERVGRRRTKARWRREGGARSTETRWKRGESMIPEGEGVEFIQRKFLGILLSLGCFIIA